MPSIHVSASWLPTLPLPFIDYTGQFRDGNLIGGLDKARILRRERFSRSYCPISVTWKVNDYDYRLLKEFFELDLEVGTAWFKIDLRYPKQSVLTNWVVKFIGGVEAVPDDGIWTVSAVLDLLFVTTLNDEAPLIGYAALWVDNTHAQSLGDDVPLYSVEGWQLYVRSPTP